jgi:hypothetical protein
LPKFTLRLFLSLFALLAALNLIQNFLLLSELKRSNRALAAIAESTATLKDDLEHIHDEVEANGEALEYITDILDRKPQR